MLPASGLKTEELVPPLPGYRPAFQWVHYTTSCNTQSSAFEDGINHRTKHVELIGIINKPLLLHLVGVYIIYDNYSLTFNTICNGERVSFREVENRVRLSEIPLLNLKIPPYRNIKFNSVVSEILSRHSLQFSVTFYQFYGNVRVYPMSRDPELNIAVLLL